MLLAEDLLLLVTDDVGPAAWGWQDQCWTLVRIAEVMRRRFGVEYTLAGWWDWPPRSTGGVLATRDARARGTYGAAGAAVIVVT
jgi:hypothetical protein